MSRHDNRYNGDADADQGGDFFEDRHQKVLFFTQFSIPFNPF